MSIDRATFFDILLNSFASAVVAFILYTILVYLPVVLYTEAKCLEHGFPEYRVSVGLEKYCMNFEGAVGVRVDKLK